MGQRRQPWTCGATTHTTRLRRLKAFFRFAGGSGWMAASPAANLRPPKAAAPVTMPLERSEMRALVRASHAQVREPALPLLMRYSGLAIRDATTLSQDALDGDQLTLRRAKSEELVVCALPPPVVDALDDIAVPGKRHFFWTEGLRPETVTKYWRGRLQRVARKAGVPSFKPHRLRDTFAVELLLAGVAMQDFSALLGHSSIRITDRHYYAPSNRCPHERRTAIVRDVNEGDELLTEIAASPALRPSAGAAPNSPRKRPGRRPRKKDAEAT